MKKLTLSFLAGMFLVAVTFSVAMAGSKVGVAKGDADLAKETAAAWSFTSVQGLPYDFSKELTRKDTLKNEAQWDDASQAAIEKLVREAITASGNFPNTSGKTVAIKPNLVLDLNMLGAMGMNKPEQRLAVDTDARVCRAVALVALEGGAKKVSFVETPANGDPYAVLKALGYEKVAEELNKKYPGKVEVADTKAIGHKWYKPPTTGGLAHKEYAIPTILVDSDIVISVPKMKTHSMAGVTLSMKCIGIGGPSSTVYGQSKFGLPHNRLAELIVDVVDIVGIDYAVIDGIWGLEGNGPVAGKPVEANIIVAGNDPIAVDWVGTELMGFKGDSIGTTRLGQKYKIGSYQNVEVAGVPIKEAMVLFENVPRANRTPGMYVHNVGWGPDAVAK